MRRRGATVSRTAAQQTTNKEPGIGPELLAAAPFQLGGHQTRVVRPVCRRKEGILYFKPSVDAGEYLYLPMEVGPMMSVSSCEREMGKYQEPLLLANATLLTVGPILTIREVAHLILERFG